MIQGLIVLNNPTYAPQRWQGTLLFYAVILVSVIFNTWLVRYLPKIEGLVLIIHVAGFFGVMIPLVYLAPHGTTKDVFTTFANGGDWPTQGLSFFVGIVTGVYAFLGQHSPANPSLGISVLTFGNLQVPTVLATWVRCLASWVFEARADY